MYKHLIILPDGTVLSSGDPGENAIRSVDLTESVNSDNELVLGASFANIMEATIWNVNGNLKLSAGDTVQLRSYKDGSDGYYWEGFFILDKPVRASANILKLTGYDCVSKLDVDLTVWFLFEVYSSPHTAKSLAEKVCEKCGLTIAFPSDMVNADFPIKQIIDKEMTGRKIMHWIGEICGCFLRASTTVPNQVEFAWFESLDNASHSITTENYYQGGLSYDDYVVAPIEGIQVKFPQEETLWPEKADALNTYTISGNIFVAGSTYLGTDDDGNLLLPSLSKDELLPYIEALEAHLLNTTSYVPFKMTLPRYIGNSVMSGDAIKITDANGVEVKTIVMTKTTKGNRITLEATGSPRRDSITVTNNPSGSSTPVSQQLNQSEIFNILTNGGSAKGLVLKNGQLYFSPNYLLKYLFSSADGTAYFDLANNVLGTKDGTSVAALSGGGFGVYDDGELVLQIKNAEDGVAVTGFDKAVNITAPTLKINDKTVAWTDNGDGTYTLTGQ